MTLLETVEALRATFPIHCGTSPVCIKGPVEAFLLEPDVAFLIYSLEAPLTPEEITAALAPLGGGA